MSRDRVPEGASEVPAFISGSELGRICEFIYARTGMLFGETKRYYIERRISERISHHEIGSVSAYLNFLRTDSREAESLINSFTVNETYFYREEHQLACLSRSILPQLIVKKRPGDRIRIWSVPCASGEEPYSIAIWLLENWNLVDAYNVEIIGSDIDTRILREAADGAYGQRSLARLSQDILERYFEPETDLRRKLITDLQESVTFTKANIVDRNTLVGIEKFDVIFCRNLLIYFDDFARNTGINNLFDALIPGGYICLGHTESMARMSAKFEMVRFPDAIVYRRPGD